MNCYVFSYSLVILITINEELAPRLRQPAGPVPATRHDGNPPYRGDILMRLRSVSAQFAGRAEAAVSDRLFYLEILAANLRFSAKPEGSQAKYQDGI
ncbi:MAG TPA: hypothetical protein VNO70_11550 [Blastocatellia bacterium]|nr:hypothetical protein [Blastocatellia bacterium]